MRLDQYLVSKKLVSTRSKARDLIKNQGVELTHNKTGKVKTVSQPSFEISDDSDFSINIDEEYIQFVSRAGLKLDYFLNDKKVDFKGKNIFDVGVSTGGFSHCALNLGAKSVLGIDVGHHQTHEDVLKYSNFNLIEGLNVKHISEHFYFNSLEGYFDVILADVSFLSVTQFINILYPYLKEGGAFILLIKPQFELGPQALNAKGVVKNEDNYKDLKDNIVKICKNMSLIDLDYQESKILGKQGNKEFFLYAKK